MLPMLWLCHCDQTAAYQKIFHPDPRIGFSPRPTDWAIWLRAGKSRPIRLRPFTGNIHSRLDAAVTAILALMVIVVLVDCAREWLAILAAKGAGPVRSGIQNDCPGVNRL